MVLFGGVFAKIFKRGGRKREQLVTAGQGSNGGQFGRPMQP